jgi:nucleoside diphosphate kinase
MGDTFQKGLEFFQKAVEVTHTAADILLDAVAGEVRKQGEERLKKFYEKSRKNLIISAILNGSMLLCLVFIVLFARELKDWGILAAALINYIIMGRAVFNIMRFIRTVMPYRKLIGNILPGLRGSENFRSAIKNSIRSVIRFYITGAPEIAQKIYNIGSAMDAFPKLNEIEDKAAEDFYPLVCRFLRVALLYNVLLFGICYGAFVFIIKRFMFNAMLGIDFLDLFAYPFVFLK